MSFLNYKYNLKRLKNEKQENWIKNFKRVFLMFLRNGVNWFFHATLEIYMTLGSIIETIILMESKFNVELDKNWNAVYVGSSYERYDRIEILIFRSSRKLKYKVERTIFSERKIVRCPPTISGIKISMRCMIQRNVMSYYFW